MKPTRKILKHNSIEFVNDFNKSSECMVLTNQSGEFFTVKKMAVEKLATEQKVIYSLSREIYTVGRLVMIIL